MIRILSWNIRQGGGSRVAKIISRIKATDAQIVSLNEYRNNKSGVRLRAELLSLGYRYQVVSNAKSDDNSVIIVSKLPCNGLIFPKSDPNYHHNVVCAQFEAFDFYGVYLPHKKKHVLFDFIQDRIASEKASIVAGDYNSGINGVDQVGKSFWYEDEIKAFNKIEYIDAFRLKNGDVKEYSWYSHQGNGYRYDHTYIHEDLSPITSACYYDHEVRQDNISDHSMMILELG